MSRLMKTVAFIFARGGSKGLPKKNTRIFAGKPLIAWAIERALEVPRIDQVIVSTDSEEIATISKQFGAEVPFIRPQKLALEKRLLDLRNFLPPEIGSADKELKEGLFNVHSDNLNP